MLIEGIDHVHIAVADRDASAGWYGKILGLIRYEPLSAWAQYPAGPLVLATSGGTPVLSVFARPPKPHSRDSTIAFRLTGTAFLEFLDGLPALQLRHRSGRVLSAADAVDHDLSWSIYLHDPDDNPIELTTYDHDVVADRLRAPS